jgi:hypothetical protein
MDHKKLNEETEKQTKEKKATIKERKRETNKYTREIERS